jgi:hypothetical protein
MVWKLLGGVGALFVGVMMFVHMRRTGGPGGRAGGMGVSPRVAAAAAMDRVRRGTESMQAGLVGGGGGGGGNGGGGGGGKPNPKAYELVEHGQAKAMGGEDEDEEEDIEML